MPDGGRQQRPHIGGRSSANPPDVLVRAGLDGRPPAAIEMESRLSLKRSQAAAIIAYRTKNGKFKSIEDLKKVPGVDAAKIEAKKDRIVF